MNRCSPEARNAPSYPGREPYAGDVPVKLNARVRTAGHPAEWEIVPRGHYLSHSRRTRNTIKSKLSRFIFAALIMPALLLAQPAHQPESRKLLVICIAGLDARFLAEPPSRVKIPNLRKLARSGFLTGGVVGVAPVGHSRRRNSHSSPVCSLRNRRLACPMRP